MDLITYEDTITGKSGKQVKRKWEVTPAAKYGIGTASTFNTLFDLFQIWKEANFERKLAKKTYDLCKRINNFITIIILPQLFDFLQSVVLRLAREIVG